MKYIDADKLIAEIERRMTENCKLAEKAKCFGDRAVEDNDILALIESFQQEQPQVADASKMEQPGAPICGEVLNDGEHLPGLTVDSAQLHDRLKGFPDGTDVYIFIVAKEENHSGAV